MGGGTRGGGTRGRGSRMPLKSAGTAVFNSISCPFVQANHSHGDLLEKLFDAAVWDEPKKLPGPSASLATAAAALWAEAQKAEETAAEAEAEAEAAAAEGEATKTNAA